MKISNRSVFAMTELRGSLGAVRGFWRVSHDQSVAVHGERRVFHHIILQHKNLMLYVTTTILFFLESRVKTNVDDSITQGQRAWLIEQRPTMGRSWSRRNSGRSFLCLNFMKIRRETMAAVTTNTDTRPAKRGSTDVPESGDHNSTQKPEKKQRREEGGKNIKLILHKFALYWTLYIMTK